MNRASVEKSIGAFIMKGTIMRVLTCEQISDGHPDKICDQIADAIVTDCLKHDLKSRVAIECLIKDNHVIIAGELTSTHKPDYRALVDSVFTKIGWERMGCGNPVLYAGPDIGILVKEQSADIALGVDKGGAGDQGIMYGYATNETPELMPIPFMVATRFLQILRNHPSRMFRADAKAQVSFDYDTGRITTFLCSVQHSPDVEVADFRHIIESIMVLAASEYVLNTDFEKLVNPTGRFVIGGPYADCGVTGRKLACDTYGGIGHIGGGALSGKDPTKVDRSAAYMARAIARNIVEAGIASRCLVSLSYAIGKAEPTAVNIDTYGTGMAPDDEIRAAVIRTFDLRPSAIIRELGLRNPIYAATASYGHFLGDFPWEKYDRMADLMEALG